MHTFRILLQNVKCTSNSISRIASKEELLIIYDCRFVCLFLMKYSFSRNISFVFFICFYRKIRSRCYYSRCKDSNCIFIRLYLCVFINRFYIILLCELLQRIRRNLLAALFIVYKCQFDELYILGILSQRALLFFNDGAVLLFLFSVSCF